MSRSTPGTSRATEQEWALVVLVAACSGGSDEPAGGSDGAGSAPQDAVQPGCSPERPAEPGTEHRSFDNLGTTREYDLSVPADYDGTDPAPLILDLHGFSSNAAQQSALTGMPEAAGERGYVVLTPQALEIDVPLTTGTITTTFWNLDPAAVLPGFEPVDDIGFLDALLDDLDGELCIDATRQYVTGMSNGAGMTMAMICGDETR